MSQILAGITLLANIIIQSHGDFRIQFGLNIFFFLIKEISALPKDSTDIQNAVKCVKIIISSIKKIFENYNFVSQILADTTIIPNITIQSHVKFRIQFGLDIFFF